MKLVFTVIGAISQWDKALWRGQNFLRHSAEYIEWQLKQIPFPENLGIEGTPSWLDPLLLGLVRGGAVILVGFILWLIFKRLWPWFQRWRTGSTATTTVQQRSIEPILSVSEWLARAERAKNQQNYAQACRALYMALLMHLEASGQLQRDPARTNQEYLQRLDALWALNQQSIEVPKAWRQIFQVHERSYYGNQPVEVETFQACQRAYQTIEPALNRDTGREVG